MFISLEQAWNLLEMISNLSLPVMIISGIVALVVVISIIQMIFKGFDVSFLVGMIMLICSPLSIFFYILMTLIYSQIEVKEILALLVTYQNTVTVSLSISWAIWFWVAWLKSDVFGELMCRIFSLLALYVIALALLEQFPLFD